MGMRLRDRAHLERVVAARAPDAEAPAPDAELVTRARAGDPAAFGVLVRRHLPAAYAVARAVVGERADAEDICQDAFTRALARLDDCRPAEKFRPWVLRIVRNRAVSFRRWQRVRVAAVLGTAPGETDLPATAESPLTAAERADLRARLTAALATLSDAERTTVVLHDVEGWGHREIAALLGVAAGTSRATLCAAHRRLRELLGAAVCDGGRSMPARLAGGGCPTLRAAERASMHEPRSPWSRQVRRLLVRAPVARSRTAARSPKAAARKPRASAAQATVSL
jgi:RNA polymerase sigma-70 factor, ECF subfamily